MRYAAIIRLSEQCSPDDFDWFTYIKEVSKETTVGELIEWQKKTKPYRKDIQNEDYLLPMTIQEME